MSSSGSETRQWWEIRAACYTLSSLFFSFLFNLYFKEQLSFLYFFVMSPERVGFLRRRRWDDASERSTCHPSSSSEGVPPLRRRRRSTNLQAARREHVSALSPQRVCISVWRYCREKIPCFDDAKTAKLAARRH